MIFIMVSGPHQRTDAATGLATLSVNGSPVGDISFEAVPGGNPLLPSAVVRVALMGLARPDIIQAVAGRERLVSSQDLFFAGLSLAWDEENLAIDIRVPASVQVEKPVAMSGKAGTGKAGVATTAAVMGGAPATAAAAGTATVAASGSASLPFAASLELAARVQPRLIVDAAGNTPRLDAEAEISPTLFFRGWTAEGSASLQAGRDPLLTLDEARVARERADGGVSIAGGLTASEVVPFGATIPLIGLALWKGPLASSGTSESQSLPAIDLDARAEISVDVNGTVVRRLWLEPGRYRLSDLPLSSGLNEVGITIEEEGKETRRLRYGLPFQAGLLLPGELSWRISGGVDREEPTQAMATLSLSLGLSRTASFSLVGAYGSGTLLGGISMDWASFLGSVSAETAFSFDPEALDPSPRAAARFHWSLGFPARPYLPRLGLGVEYRDAGFSPPEAAPVPGTAQTVPDGAPYHASAQVSQALAQGLGVAATGEAAFSAAGDLMRYSGYAGLSLSLRSAALLSVSAGYVRPVSGESSWSLSLSMSAAAPGGSAIQYRRDLLGASDSFGASIPLGTERGPSLSLSAEGFPEPGITGEHSLSLGLSLPGSALGLSAGASYLQSPETGTEWGASLAARTTLVAGGGTLAALADPGWAYAVLVPDATTSGEHLELRAENGRIIASSPAGKPVIAALSRGERIAARLELPDAPPGTELANPLRTLDTSLRTIAVIRAEVATIIAATGRVLRVDGLPAAGLYGEVFGPGGLPCGDVFTDPEGRFVGYLPETGSYRIAWAEGTETRFIVVATGSFDPASPPVELGDFTAQPDSGGIS